ncbi:conserved hypothetical protein [Histoplasma capsulatum G186AR]|uniref:Mediator of RNA polymerase II transcription subunit 1 n=2 Tax=Ajellomyces capsulatus TaxID=5037 RepID=C0NN58_AJECG|nr:uncharacterized protein HCBG_04185 [Histoplasma capsulatum G186AR]EEH07306.1 conserved hypothetical protein [Histoplasma capsulatum G186AR]KAG5304562.1 Med1 superfamily domain-containing protein [Histoplasma capsulatum]QSS70160.1 Med1 superfamily domain-containing protein [Histoplasma capsulatum G186AR]
MATPSSRHNPGQTPHPTSSPHPSAVPMGRPLSHKSPSIRTPSASGHGHHPSISSHQYPTPMAAPTSVEDAVAFSSPSALLALGLGGITPSPAGNDALTGPGINENGIHSMGMSALGMGGPRDTDEEKARRMEEVIRLLRTRVSGRGICREGVERLGKFEGFECMWQENILSIAGNLVDLEIQFEDGSENVKDVSLKYTTPSIVEGERRVEATAVLKRDLMQTVGKDEEIPWKSLDAFHSNLHRLAKLDRLSREINCFEAVEGLYKSLNRLWEGELSRYPGRGHYEHVCTSQVGHPGIHQDGRIGLSLQYWVEQRQTLDSNRNGRPNAMNIDQPTPDDRKPAPAKIHKTWRAAIECEEGYPSLRVSKEWIAAELFTTMNNGESSLAADGNDSEILLVNWIDPPATLVSNPNDVPLDSTALGTTTPNRRFVARLEPPIDMPIIAAAEVYRLLGMNMPVEPKTVTYDGLVVPLPNLASTGDGQDDNSLAASNGRIHEKVVYSFDDDCQPRKHRHIYTFHPFEHIVGRTIRDLPFSHPRQLADVLPILRQYALLSSLLHRVFVGQNNQTVRSSKSPSAHSVISASPNQTSKSDVTFITNISPTVSKLNAMLSRDDSKHVIERSNGIDSHVNAPFPPAPATDDRKIDISLRTPILGPPSLMLLFNAPKRGPNASMENPTTITINIDIGLNGNITVSRVGGMWDDVSDSTEGPLNDISRTESPHLHQSLARVLQISEDFGILVEWVLKWMRNHEDHTNR